MINPAVLNASQTLTKYDDQSYGMCSILGMIDKLGSMSYKEKNQGQQAKNLQIINA